MSQNAKHHHYSHVVFQRPVPTEKGKGLKRASPTPDPLNHLRWNKVNNLTTDPQTVRFIPIFFVCTGRLQAVQTIFIDLRSLCLNSPYCIYLHCSFQGKQRGVVGSQPRHDIAAVRFTLSVSRCFQSAEFVLHIHMR